MAAKPWQSIRNVAPDTRPNPANLLEGQIALNIAAETPAIYFKDAAGTLAKAGTAHVGTTAPNAVPAGFIGNSVGEQWLDLANPAAPALKVWDGVSWVLAGGGPAPAPYVLPASTTTTLGGVIVGTGLLVDAAGTLSAEPATPYVLPAATTTALGGVIAGSGLDIAADGTISLALEVVELKGSADITIAAPAATLGNSYIASSAGVAEATWTGIAGTQVNAGDLLLFDGTSWIRNEAASVSGVTSVTGVAPITIGGTATAPQVSVAIATAATAGVVSVGSGLAVDAAGVVSLNAPLATATTVGVASFGDGLAIDAAGMVVLVSDEGAY
jgi:hypothetical protein